MTNQHLQDQARPSWENASDEQIISALFQPVRFVNPRWINYLERNRPTALKTYLRMRAAGGGCLGRPALEFLANG
jgi:hypothetical protein